MEESRLLGLPPELQTYIYELVLVAGDSICIHDRTRFRTSNHFKVPWLSLLSTCHSIRAIAKPIYFERNNFVFVVFEGDRCDETLGPWMEKFAPVLVELGQRIEISAVIDIPLRHGRQCYFAKSRDRSYAPYGSVPIYVDFKKRKVDAWRSPTCCRREQRQFAPVVEYLEKFLKELS